METHPRVSIIILNWNNWKDTIECLESVYKIDYSNYDVIVVDNGSEDDSITKIKEYAEGKLAITSKYFYFDKLNKPIKIFEYNDCDKIIEKINSTNYELINNNRKLILYKNKRNYGYTGGNNIGMRLALTLFNPSYILILNNDTVVDKNFLRELINCGESDKDIGIIGPIIFYYNYKGRSDVIQFAGAKINIFTLNRKILGYKKVYNDIKIINNDSEEVHGACMLIKKEVLYEIGFFDERYFAYWDETDFCFRARKKGYLLKIVCTSKIWHKTGSNRPDVKKISPLAAYFYGRNGLLFINKNFFGFNKLFLLLYYCSIKLFFDISNYLLNYKNPFAMYMYLSGILRGLCGEAFEPAFYYKKIIFNKHYFIYKT